MEETYKNIIEDMRHYVNDSHKCNLVLKKVIKLQDKELLEQYPQSKKGKYMLPRKYIEKVALINRLFFVLDDRLNNT